MVESHIGMKTVERCSRSQLEVVRRAQRATRRMIGMKRVVMAEVFARSWRAAEDATMISPASAPAAFKQSDEVHYFRAVAPPRPPPTQAQQAQEVHRMLATGRRTTHTKTSMSVSSQCGLDPFDKQTVSYNRGARPYNLSYHISCIFVGVKFSLVKAHC